MAGPSKARMLDVKRQAWRGKTWYGKERARALSDRTAALEEEHEERRHRVTAVDVQGRPVRQRPDHFLRDGGRRLG